MKHLFTKIMKKALVVVAAMCATTAMADNALVGNWFVFSGSFESGVESAWGNTYADRFDITIEPAGEGQSSWDLAITNLCGQGRVYGGTLSEDGKTLTLNMPGYCYFSDRDYTDKGTESLGDANCTIKDPVTITLQDDGTLAISDFSALCTKLADGAMTITTLATYKSVTAVPYSVYHYKPATFTKVNDSAWDNEYPEEFDFRLRKVIENDNYDVVASDFCGVKDAKTWGTMGEEGVITLGMLTATYFTDRDYQGKGTESLGDTEGTMMGTITLTPNEKGYDVSDFAAINLSLSTGAPVITILNKYEGGAATLVTGGETAIKHTTATDANVVAVEYYNINGMKLSAPCKGVNLVKSICADGTFVTRKVTVK